MPFKVIKELYDANMSDDYRTFVNQGGTSSGKTYTLMQVLFTHAMNERGAVITVCGQDLPNLKVGALRDAKTIINASDWMQQFFKVNESGSFITGINGSVIEYKSYENAQDAKSGKRDYLFINEANGIPYEIYWQLAMRTRKKVYLDYNPSARFWVHDEVVWREGTRLIISDHRGNPFLTKEEHDRIEGISDPELWKVYARGATGQITGLVLTNWDIVDAMPAAHERKMTVYGMDFGFSCFRGDTLIMCKDGEKPIKDVTINDYVLTRKGYRKVRKNIYNGYKKVIHKKFKIGLYKSDFFCTFEHNFNTDGKWKKYGELTKKDKLCMLSNSMAWNLEDTQTENTGITITTSGKKTGNTKLSSYIMQYMKKRMVVFPKVWLFITQISIHLITILKTLLQLRYRNTCEYITNLGNGTESMQMNYGNGIIQKIIGKYEGRRFSTVLQKKSESVNTAGKNTLQQTHTNVSAENIVITNGNIKQRKTISKWCVKIVEKFSWVINTSNRNAVPINAHMKWLRLSELKNVGEVWCDVYDLEIDSVHEYFANGILVHNCDPTALEEVALAHGDLYIDERIYSTGMTNPDIVEECKRQGLTRHDLIVADSAEPKSIRELKNGGLWVIGADKGKDSIVVGLDILRRYRLHVTKRSRGLIDNLKSYQWRKDRDGRMTNTPEDGNDHGIDAIRYAALAKLGARRTGTSKATVIRN